MYRLYFLRYGFQQDNFSDFLLFHPNLSLFRLPPFRCGLHRIASVGRPRSGAKVIPGCYAAARSVPSVLEKISTPTLHCVLLWVVFSLKNLAFAHPYLCGAPETKTTDATGRCIKKYRINERQISSETQLPQALGSALNIKTLRKMEKSINIRQALRTILRLLLTSILSIVFWAVGVVVGSLAEIVAGILRTLWAIVLYVLTLVSILALILWIFTL